MSSLTDLLLCTERLSITTFCPRESDGQSTSRAIEAVTGGEGIKVAVMPGMEKGKP